MNQTVTLNIPPVSFTELIASDVDTYTEADAAMLDGYTEWRDALKAAKETSRGYRVTASLKAGGYALWALPYHIDRNANGHDSNEERAFIRVARRLIAELRAAGCAAITP